MPKIHVLDQDTINQIAAGEVIERPMAVVKELCENAIDAGANAITVEIKDGGKSLIRITDNGCGMEKEDIPLAFAPHATSKIHSAADLLNVSSLGFRGEALASIASISQLELLTKIRDGFLGNRVEIHGGEQVEFGEVGCPEGTTIIVRNLFYNTPARLKFLKSSATEAGYISGVIERLALSHPEIAFRFINQNQSKLVTPGNGNLKDVIYHIYGRDIASNLLEINSKEVFCKVEGFLGKPVISRGNRAYLNYFINGRYIKSNVITKAIEEAYHSYVMQHRYPFTTLHFTIDPALIDVNVHPQKMEIRFTKEQEIFQSVFHAVSAGLQHKEFIPSVVDEPKQSEKTENYGKKIVSNKAKSSIRPTEQFEINRKSEEHKQKEKEEEIKAKVKPAEVIKHQDEVKQEDIIKHADAKKQIEQINEETSKENTVNRVQEEGAYKPPKSFEELRKPVQQSLFSEEKMQEESYKDLKIIGQVFSTYLIVQWEDTMYMVDQHAAHEKILYEEFVKKIEARDVMTQMVQPPTIITLSMAEENALLQNMKLFEELGFSIENFGGKEFAVTGIPANLPNVDVDDLLMELLGMMVNDHGTKQSEILKDRIATMACKAAVKGNNYLDALQAEELMKKLLQLDNPYHCPHGRPTMIVMTKRELEKKFKRIV